MSVTLEALVQQQSLTESQRAFVERHVLKSGQKTFLGGKKKVTPDEQQEVVLYKEFLARREKLLTVMKSLPLRTVDDIGFADRLVQANQAHERGDIRAATDLIDGLTENAWEVRRNCIVIHSRLTVVLAGLKDPEGVEPELLRQANILRGQAQSALDSARDARFDFTASDRAVTALETFIRSAPKLGSLNNRSPVLARHAETVLGELDVVIADITASDAVRAKAASGKAKLSAAINHGPLSGETGRPLDEASAKIFMKAFAQDPDLADAALKEASTAKHPGAVAQGLELLIPHVQAGFPNATGLALSDEAAQRYGKTLLAMGGHVGAEYFDLMPGYLAGKHYTAPHPMGDVAGKNTAQVVRDRGLHLASRLMKPGGEIDLETESAQLAIGHTLFHFDSIMVATPAMNANVLSTIKALGEPRATEVLRGVTAPTSPGGLSLVRGALGKGGEEAIDADATRMSVLSAMFKPLNQGKVGSCFATAPVRQMRETQPLEAMRVLGEIASSGQYKPPNGVRVPAVTAIPEGDDPLQRSWEYSLATSAARSEDSVERKKFVAELARPLDGMSVVLKGTEEENTEALRKLKLDVSNAFALQYDATADLGAVASDGSSRKGHFVAIRDGRTASSFKEFGDQLRETVMASLGIADPTSELGQEVAAALDHEMLVLSRFSDFKPWDIPSGGTDAPTVALYGNDMAKQSVVEVDVGSTKGERSARILASLMKSFGAAPGGMVGMGVSGTHSFNGLPDHPSLQKLKSGEEGGMSEPALRLRIQAELVDKGRALSQTDLTPERAAWMFDQRLEAVLAQETDPELKLMLRDITRAKRPKKAMKPAVLSTAVTDALRPYFATANTGKRPATSARSVTSAMTNQLLRELGAPEFVLADSNWGDGTMQILFVVAPDPTTGEPLMWRKTEPPGTLSPLDPDWLEQGWFQAGAAG